MSIPRSLAALSVTCLFAIAAACSGETIEDKLIAACTEAIDQNGDDMFFTGPPKNTDQSDEGIQRQMQVISDWYDKYGDPPIGVEVIETEYNDFKATMTDDSAATDAWLVNGSFTVKRQARESSATWDDDGKPDSLPDLVENDARCEAGHRETDGEIVIFKIWSGNYGKVLIDRENDGG